MRVVHTGLLIPSFVFLAVVLTSNITFFVTPTERLEPGHVNDTLATQVSKVDDFGQGKPLVSSVPDDEFIGTEDAQRMLKTFNKALRRFASEEGFDYIDFETHIEELRNEISNIEFFAETELNDPTIKRQIRFARKTFLWMVDSTDKLKRYSRYDLPAYDLVHEMLELHIRALCLYDHYGFIDQEHDGFAVDISNFYLELYLWEKEFKNIDHVPTGVRVVFKNASDQVKKTLEVWRNQLADLI